MCLRFVVHDEHMYEHTSENPEESPLGSQEGDVEEEGHCVC